MAGGTARAGEEALVFTRSGGIEVARTPERLEELKRRLASAKWGEAAELLTPAEVRRLVPFLDEKIILGQADRDPAAGGTEARERPELGDPPGRC